ncbi:hypothetical protein MC885_003737 [Smutsia gigantea]|nr:hypothetical protein MC885_003737 [Smutsia gigantea]
MGLLQSRRPDWPDDILRCSRSPLAIPAHVNPGQQGVEAPSQHSPVMEAGLLGAILLNTLMAQLEMAMQDLDMRKIAGFWREVGVASNQNLALKTPKRLEALFLTLTGRLTVKAARNSLGSCETEKILGSEIDVSGKFVFPGKNHCRVAAVTSPALLARRPWPVLFGTLRGAGQQAHGPPPACPRPQAHGPPPACPRPYHVPGMDYERYAILRLSLHWQGNDFHVLKYFTRSLEDEDEPGFWKFR